MIERVKAMIASCVVLDHVLEDDEDLLMSGVLDSISTMKLVASIEEDLNLTIPASDVTIENFQTPRVLAGYIESHQS